MTPAARRAATARKRRYRERLRNGRIIAPVPVSNEIVTLLLDTRWLALAG